ncbi:MAG: GNAT family N-acetyltransferase [Pseudomonadota bacterium]
MTTIKLAESVSEREAAFRFWYRIYVVEMGRHSSDPNVCHTRQRLFDPMAAAGLLQIAREDTGIVGTLLTTPADHPAAEKYRALYQLDRLAPGELATATVTTKLMVAPSARGGRLALSLIRAARRAALERGFTNDFADCNDHLVPLFQRLGFHRHLAECVHPVYGAVNVMRIGFGDTSALSRAGSPLLDVGQRAPLRAAKHPNAAQHTHINTKLERAS